MKTKARKTVDKETEQPEYYAHARVVTSDGHIVGRYFKTAEEFHAFLDGTEDDSSKKEDAD